MRFLFSLVFVLVFSVALTAEENKCSATPDEKQIEKRVVVKIKGESCDFKCDLNDCEGSCEECSGECMKKSGCEGPGCESCPQASSPAPFRKSRGAHFPFLRFPPDKKSFVQNRFGAENGWTRKIQIKPCPADKNNPDGPKKFSFHFRDVDLKDALLTAARAAGESVILHPSLSGKVNLSVTDIDFSTFLNVLATALDLEIKQVERVHIVRWKK